MSISVLTSSSCSVHSSSSLNSNSSASSAPSFTASSISSAPSSSSSSVSELWKKEDVDICTIEDELQLNAAIASFSKNPNDSLWPAAQKILQEINNEIKSKGENPAWEAFTEFEKKRGLKSKIIYHYFGACKAIAAKGKNTEWNLSECVCVIASQFKLQPYQLQYLYTLMYLEAAKEDESKAQSEKAK